MLFRRFHCVRQHDAMQCGIACLAMVCRHYGRRMSIASIAEICHASNEGLSMLAINQAASALGMRSTGVRITTDRLAQSPMPCILHWNQNHFVVLYDIRSSNTFCIADPAKGLINYSRTEFEQCWISTHNNDEPCGIAMIIEPTPQFFALSSPADNAGDSRSLKFLMKYIAAYRRPFAAILVALIVGSLLQLALPLLTQQIVDVGIHNKDIGFVWLILLAQLMLTVSRTAIDFCRRRVLMKISMHINISLVSDFLAKLLRLPMWIFDTKTSGDLMQRIADHSRVNTFLTEQSLNVAFASLSLAMFASVLLYYNAPIFGVFAAGAAVYALWNMAFLRRRRVVDYEIFERQATANNNSFQLLTTIQEIKLQDCEQRRRQEWEAMQKGLYDVQLKSLRLQQTYSAGSIFITEVINIIITVMAAAAVINTDITLGAMLAIQFIIGQLISPVEQLTQWAYALQDVKISLERINEIRQINGEDNSTSTGQAINCPEKGIAFNHVTFRYDPHASSATLSDINIAIPHGKVTAIVGASGSGKTTLLKLLLGYYPIEAGCIAVGNTKITTLNKQWWRRQCGVVMQDGVIFAESIARNIATDDGEIKHKRLVEAAQIACIHDHIMSLPLKYETRIGHDGIGLSAGQKQRILIARAVYRNPDYIFLDEATNSLDAVSERAIVDNLSRFYHSKTVVVIAHRLSTVQNAQQIVVLDGGKVVECGCHQSLIAKRGVYYHLVKNQLELGC
ncbi:MAG: peptidase domain-containing ABC transporter [Muribaculaceae bacterium]